MKTHVRRLSLVLTLAMLVPVLTIPAPGGSHGVSAAAHVDKSAEALQVCGSCEFTSITEAVESAPSGSIIEVNGGTFSGPLVLAKAVTLTGVGSPVIDGGNKGTVLRIAAPNVTVQGFVIQNSGANFDKEDSGVYVEGSDVQILDNTILNTLFGINVATSADLLIARNTIVGMDADMGLRGDGIKVWYSHGTHILKNRIERSRDLLVWYSDDVIVRDNTVVQGRYGFHFMNSNNGLAEHNSLVDNSVGIYLMYGKGFTIRDNLLQGSRGPSGHGIGLKELDGALVEGNILYDNRIGVYIDNSPLSPDIPNYFRKNIVAYNDTGLGMLPLSRNNVFSQNSFVENLEQVMVLGAGRLGVNHWSENGIGNFWSDYAGYDADGDNIGDIPFRSEHLSEQLMSSLPILQLFRFSVAESAVDFGSRAVPMFRQDPTFIDSNPLVKPVVPGNAASPEYRSNPRAMRIWSVGLLAVVTLIMSWGWRGRRPLESTWTSRGALTLAPAYAASRRKVASRHRSNSDD